MRTFAVTVRKNGVAEYVDAKRVEIMHPGILAFWDEDGDLVHAYNQEGWVMVRQLDSVELIDDGRNATSVYGSGPTATRIAETPGAKEPGTPLEKALARFEWEFPKWMQEQLGFASFEDYQEAAMQDLRFSTNVNGYPSPCMNEQNWNNSKKGLTQALEVIERLRSEEQEKIPPVYSSAPEDVQAQEATVWMPGYQPSASPTEDPTEDPF